LAASGNSAFSVSAKEVTSITLRTTAATGSVIIVSEDAENTKALENMANSDDNLISLGGGSFRFEATAANANAVLNFGADNKIDISNLKFANVATSSLDNGTLEKIIIETNEAVSVTKVGSKDGGEDVSVAAFNMLSGTNAGKISAANGVGVLTEGATASSDSLKALKDLKENGLTSDIANKFIDLSGKCNRMSMS